MRHRHPILPCEPGQVLIEAAISIGKMWVAVPDRDTFFSQSITINLVCYLTSHVFIPLKNKIIFSSLVHDDEPKNPFMNFIQ